ncbi:hypothetical protein [Neobacillus sp. YIM B06451]|uniref:hypothetical protein n=1 Tax=Neobacillus sp. YIM B06451 TaxID=3070994 RepID=UPI00292ECE7D|nr:hypothetical protein [Neobacillus sp. YIM B06451]
MDDKQGKFEIGDNALKGGIAGIVVVAGTTIVLKYLDDRKQIKLHKAGKPVVADSNTHFIIDPKNWKFGFKRKAKFEVKEVPEKIIIKEVPVVPGFKQTKTVQVRLDKNGKEIPGSQEDIVG